MGGIQRSSQWQTRDVDEIEVNDRPAEAEGHGEIAVGIGAS